MVLGDKFELGVGEEFFSNSNSQLKLVRDMQRISRWTELGSVHRLIRCYVHHAISLVSNQNLMKGSLSLLS